MTATQRIWMTEREFATLQGVFSRHSERQAGIREIERVSRSAIDERRVAEPGMVLTIRYDDSGETETFLLGRRGAEGTDIKVYSMASPLGRVIRGARPGDQRIYSIPDETGRLVTLLEAVPYQRYVEKAERRAG